MPFYFAQITDTHLGAHNNQERTDSIITAINQLSIKPDFIIVTGDILNNYTDSTEARQARNLFSKINFPIYFSAGNHDLKKDFANNSITYFENIFGKSDTSFFHKGVVLIGFNSNIFSDSVFTKSNPELIKIKKLVSKTKTPKILFTHLPPCDNFYNNKTHESWNPKYIASFKDIITHKNVMAIISGHLHRDELHYIGNTPIYSCAPVSASLGRQASFRLYCFNNGKLSYTTIFLE